MSKEDACFIYGGEIYHTIGAADEEIDNYLQKTVDYAEYDHINNIDSIRILAQDYLIKRQINMIIRKYCK